MPSPNPPNPLGRSSAVDNFLGTIEVLLTIAKDVSSVAAVPFMRDAAELSLGVLDTVQTVRENTEEWIRLARDVAQLVAAVATKVERTGPDKLGRDTMDQIEQLYRLLLELDGVVKKMNSRKLLKRIVRFRDDGVKLQQYRKDLTVAIGLFGVRAAITNAENMQNVSASQSTLLDGQQNLQAKQDEVLSGQQMTNEFLHRIDTSINALKTSSLVSSPSSSLPVSPEHTMSPFSPYSESPTHYFHTMPTNAKITVINGDQVTNNVHTVNTNIRSNRVTTINTINSHNASTLPVASPNARRNTKTKRAGRHHTVPPTSSSRQYTY